MDDPMGQVIYFLAISSFHVYVANFKIPSGLALMLTCFIPTQVLLSDNSSRGPAVSAERGLL